MEIYVFKVHLGADMCVRLPTKTLQWNMVKLFTVLFFYRNQSNSQA